MRTRVTRILTSLLALGAIAALNGAPRGASNSASVPKNPFLVNNGLIPKPSQYKGPLFKLNHAWPSRPLPPIQDAPWTKAIGGGLITTENAAAYVDALKQYVSANARQLIVNYPNWDAAKARWYSEPWLGTIRESIHGTYAAGTFGPNVFPGTGLKTTFDTHVLTYYDERAAYTLYKVWGNDAMQPKVKTENFQFDEGAVVVKAAVFVSDDPKMQSNWWPATSGAAQWPLFVAIPESNPGPTSVVNGYVMQFDIIVKDSKAAPKTGWVFATLVYDASAGGADAWDRMVPLGAMWGNDPDVNSELPSAPPLKENWINPSAPKYSKQTLGWGGRLSGPNDGARNDIQVGTTVLKNFPNSSCMSCHGPAEWQSDQHKMLSFLLPSYPNPNPGPPFKPCPDGKPDDLYICSPAPGSADWSRWFQDRTGTQPQNPGTGSVATDYDMVFAFKTLPMWWKAMGPADQPMPFTIRQLRGARTSPKRVNEYTGAPLKTP